MKFGAISPALAPGLQVMPTVPPIPMDGARRVTSVSMPEHDSQRSPDDDDDFPVDDETALGDTPQAHEGLDPHDLPPDHPSRQDVEEEPS